MKDISRRNFLKGTGKTILTGAVAGTMGVSGGTTTPIKKVASKASGLAVKLSPKAKAYRHYLQAIKGMATLSALETEANKDPTGTNLDDYHKRVEKRAKREFKDFARPHQPKSGVKSLARNSFESAIDRKRSGTGQKTNPYSDHIAHQKEYRLARRLALGKGTATSSKEFHKNVNETSKDLHSTARTSLAIEKTMARRKKEKMKIKSKGARMGGGKFIEGQETPRNPTGMSLVTRRSILM